VRRAVDDFASECRVLLEQHRKAGLDFVQAWDLVVAEIYPADRRTWGKLEDRVGGAEDETPMTLLYRHMRAAYVGRSAAGYCPEDCDQLLPCPRHGVTDDH
jgi:hypothetical protein